jgi:hypothetical protein
MLFSNTEASEQAQIRAVDGLFWFQSGTWAQSWAHFLKSCPFAAHPAIQRVRAFTAWRNGVASLRAAGASLSGSPVAKRRPASADFLADALHGFGLLS